MSCMLKMERLVDFVIGNMGQHPHLAKSISNRFGQNLSIKSLAEKSNMVDMLTKSFEVFMDLILSQQTYSESSSYPNVPLLSSTGTQIDPSKTFDKISERLSSTFFSPRNGNQDPSYRLSQSDAYINPQNYTEEGHGAPKRPGLKEMNVFLKKAYPQTSPIDSTFQSPKVHPPPPLPISKSPLITLDRSINEDSVPSPRKGANEKLGAGILSKTFDFGPRESKIKEVQWKYTDLVQNWMDLRKEIMETAKKHSDPSELTKIIDNAKLNMGKSQSPSQASVPQNLSVSSFQARQSQTFFDRLPMPRYKDSLARDSAKRAKVVEKEKQRRSQSPTNVNHLYSQSSSIDPEASLTPIKNILPKPITTADREVQTSIQSKAQISMVRGDSLSSLEKNKNQSSKSSQEPTFRYKEEKKERKNPMSSRVPVLVQSMSSLDNSPARSLPGDHQFVGSQNLKGSFKEKEDSASFHPPSLIHHNSLAQVQGENEAPTFQRAPTRGWPSSPRQMKKNSENLEEIQEKADESKEEKSNLEQKIRMTLSQNTEGEKVGRILGNSMIPEERNSFRGSFVRKLQGLPHTQSAANVDAGGALSPAYARKRGRWGPGVNPGALPLGQQPQWSSFVENQNPRSSIKLVPDSYDYIYNHNTIGAKYSNDRNSVSRISFFPKHSPLNKHPEEPSETNESFLRGSKSADRHAGPSKQSMTRDRTKDRLKQVRESHELKDDFRSHYLGPMMDIDALPRRKKNVKHLISSLELFG